jgi:NAD(P)-dependent dehydrogenase (short-subunit alcohol dehydrogenase family)
MPPQHQEHQPGRESQMHPAPEFDDLNRQGCGRLIGRVAVITGGDSGIGRAVAVAFAKEGADVAIVYLEEDEDAEATREAATRYGHRFTAIRGDVSDERFCRQAVQRVVDEFGKIDVLVNNAGQQYEQYSLEDVSAQQLEHTFGVNLFAMFYMTQAALKHMPVGSAIVNTSSVTAYKGKESLLDYSSTKGAIVSFTRSLSQQLAPKGIRVNAVAPGPVWTPLIPASYTAEEVAEFGSDVPMGRPAQPREIAPSYVFLASEDASYMSGQVLHPNGGTIVES